MHQNPTASLNNQSESTHQIVTPLPDHTFRCTAVITAPHTTTASPVAPGGSLMLPHNRWQRARSTRSILPLADPRTAQLRCSDSTNMMFTAALQQPLPLQRIRQQCIQRRPHPIPPMPCLPH
jgi:hypothetical protein